MGGHREKVAVYKARRQTSEGETNLEGTLISKLRRSELLLFKLTRLWLFVKAAQSNRCTNELLCYLGRLIQYL